MTPGPRVVIADSQALMAEALEKLLAPECVIVGRVSDGLALLEIVQAEHPDVAVIDVALPLLNGLDAGTQARQIDRALKIVVVTANEDPDLAAHAIRTCASAFLLKRCAGAELVKAIREVMQGRSYVTPLVTEGLVGALMTDRKQGPARELTNRQREVLQLLAEGRSMKEVANLVNLTPRTVAFHKYQMMKQLKVTTTAELIQYAVKHHIV